MLILNRDLVESEIWSIISPVCREIKELVDGGFVKFISGTHNDSNDTFTINLKSRKIHIASRTFKDSIGDIEYNDGKIRIGLRTGNRPANLFIDIE